VVDAYTMKESVQDNITVRIVYEGRAAKVLLERKSYKRLKNTTRNAPKKAPTITR